VTSDTAGEGSGEHAAARPGPRRAPPSRASASAALGTAGTYEVRPGDSLWSIAGQRLGTEASAAEIAAFVDRLWELNAGVIRSASPEVILPGESLRLPRTR